MKIRFRIVLFLSLGMSGIASCGSADNTNNTDQPRAKLLSEMSGQENFQIQCAQCHGRNGAGTDLGYGLQQPVANYATWVLRNGRPKGKFGVKMPHYTEQDVSNQQLEEIIAWLKSFPKPTSGEGLYTIYCANCHGTDGRGGDSRVDIQHEWGSTHEIWEYIRYGAGDSLYEKRGEYMPAWAENELTESDIELIRGHLEVLHFQ